jgi:hypothetical protein
MTGHLLTFITTLAALGWSVVTLQSLLADRARIPVRSNGPDEV